MIRSYVGLGSNLAEPEAQIRRAIRCLSEADGVHALRASSLYRSKPLGPAGQADYCNAAVAMDTEHSAQALLQLLLTLELEAGRRRDGPRWGSRILDLDLLVYGEETHDQPELQVPHPELANRNFVVLPLLELAPELIIPGLGPLSAVAAAADRSGIEIW